MNKNDKSETENLAIRFQDECRKHLREGFEMAGRTIGHFGSQIHVGVSLDFRGRTCHTAALVEEIQTEKDLQIIAKARMLALQRSHEQLEKSRLEVAKL